MAKSQRELNRTRSAASRVKAKQEKRRPPEDVTRDDIEFIARGCLIERGRVLVCENTKHGYLYLPGGHIEFQESAARALSREFLEECGLAVSVRALGLVSEGSFRTRKRAHHEINLVFHVERVGGGGGRERDEIRSREKGIAFHWVDLATVVDRDIRPNAAKAWLTTLSGRGPTGVEWVSEMDGGVG
jgi:8-oxo-dGTP diphosphatase